MYVWGLEDVIVLHFLGYVEVRNRTAVFHGLCRVLVRKMSRVAKGEVKFDTHPGLCTFDSLVLTPSQSSYKGHMCTKAMVLGPSDVRTCGVPGFILCCLTVAVTVVLKRKS